MTNDIMKLADDYAINPYREGTHSETVYRNKARAALAEAVKKLECDAIRGRFMIATGGWHRSEEQTHLAVLVPHGSDLSCVAMREDAIDAAVRGGAK